MTIVISSAYKISFQLLKLKFIRRSFLFILTALRFDDRSTREERKKIDKQAAISSIYDKFVENCKNEYIPSERMSISSERLMKCSYLSKEM